MGFITWATEERSEVDICLSFQYIITHIPQLPSNYQLSPDDGTLCTESLTNKIVKFP